ncbi:MAG: type II secretion system minor pseudopilin GspK [Burkholderiales bacterium]
METLTSTLQGRFSGWKAQKPGPHVVTRAHLSGRRQYGAALLMAMMIVALVATLSASMVWQQWRSVQVEAAERARAQSAWILTGALDWARLILREDARNGGPDHLGEVWAAPLAEARLSTFLALDKSQANDGPEAFLSGSITDAQSRYNLSNLIREGRLDPAEQGVLQRLFENINVPPDTARRIAQIMLNSNFPPHRSQQMAVKSASGAGEAPATAQIPPRSVAQLAWFGIDPGTLQHLERYVVLLPRAAPVNINTAPREVLAAVIQGLDLATAQRLIEKRQRDPFNNLQDAAQELPESVKLEGHRVTTQTEFFEVRGRLRLEGRWLEERTLVHRFGREVAAIFRERVNASAL